MNDWAKAQVLLFGMPSSSTASDRMVSLRSVLVALPSVAFAVMSYQTDLSIASDMDTCIIVFTNSRQAMDNLDKLGSCIEEHSRDGVARHDMLARRGAS